jgi:lambda family phage portal protein
MTGDMNKIKPNILDRTIAFLNPKGGLKRLQARRSYEAAQYGTRNKSMKGATSNGPNVEVGVALQTLRNRSRSFVRNNGWAKRALGVIVTNTIGEGIRPAPTTGTKNQIKKIKQIWKHWAESTECDWDGNNTFYGLQQLIMSEIAEGGDCLIIRRRVKPTRFNPIPIKIQVLEGDQLDHQRNFLTDDGYCRLGVQFNKEGLKTGYWVWSSNPNDMAINWTGIQSELISIDDVLQPFEVLRAGQVRGVPIGVSSFMKMSDFSDYEDAQLVRQKVAAAFAAFVKGHEFKQDEETDLTERIEPGIIQYLQSEEEITFSNPPGADGYGDYSKKILQGIAAGYEITYEMLTMDYSNVNFTSGRMAKIDVSGRFRKLQYNLMVPQVCVPIWRWFMDSLMMVGLSGVFIDCDASDWTAPRVQQLDPVKETNARVLQVQSGFTSLSEIAREDGRDFDELLEEIKLERKKIEDAGLNFSSVIAPIAEPVPNNIEQN